MNGHAAWKWHLIVARDRFTQPLPMTGSERYLRFSQLENGQPVIAFCSVCGERFEVQPEADELIDDLILKARTAFDAHTCKDFSRS
jgi:hypothetical protein